MSEVRLVLPLPPSPNRRSSNVFAEQAAKNKYRREAWLKAIEQAMPKAEEDLPEKVIVEPVFYVRNRRDEADNLPFSMKWVLDCLKARQAGKLHWREGLYEWKGYLVDDDPEHCQSIPPVQHIDRKEPRLELTIRAA